ncbi:BamA/TamA family outer membrane protein [Flavobacterium sp.]|uniref:translocation and assembly module lipoprotein TamL n=1 Tax=Flavobacterium sp. TaxID=239 RepID=UPI0026233BAC|nr:BamA/TamA family outer membrane protein [Flavobacterium sp.]
MKNHITKISLFILIGLLVTSCNTTKRVPKNKRLLIKNEISVDNQSTKDEEVFNQLYQKPNSSILGYRLRLNLFNLAKKNTDSSYKAKFIKNPEKYKRKAKFLSKKQVDRLGHSFWHEGIHNFLKKTGEAPVILDTNSTNKSLRRLRKYYFDNGFFDVKTSFTADSSQTKKVKIKYSIDKGNGFKVDSIKTNIATPALDSIYKNKIAASFFKTGKQYTESDWENERNRITADFRNNGAFFFQQNYISRVLDTINTNKKVHLDLNIKNQNIRVNDTSRTQEFKLYKINKVNIFTDHPANRSVVKVNDSVTYKDFNFYSENKLKYRPKAITNAVFISKGGTYSDVNTTLTSKYLSNLRVFNYPVIQYKVDPKDENGLIANVFLTPRKKYTFGLSADFTHSNIQDFGISGNTSLGIRNVFNGAETFEIAFRGNIGSSRDIANPNGTFFNISEFGIDSKLNFPRILLPFKTDKIIPKSMIPSTTLSVGYAKQRNIGLDKENFTSSLTYNWTPRKNKTARFDLLNVQFVKNVNISNYFNIYESSYDILNDLAIAYGADALFFKNGKLEIDQGTNGFINQVFNSVPSNLNVSDEDLKTISSIEERRKRLTENNLIFATSFSFSQTSKSNLQDNSFHVFRTKIESAGNVLSLFARASNQLINQSGANTIFDVEYSQYIKTEFEYIKHWDLNRKKVFAIRSFFGIAIPYSNSKNIPFSRSYFAGGTNDNRAWQPYSLGPGSSGGINDFNEANMKISFNAELRFNIFGNLNGALFGDLGNIWNVFDDVEDETYQFNGLKSLETIALGTGFGLRYDFGLFVVRGDLGFKTYNPAKLENEKWFKEINLSKSVVNIGINYPF